MAARPAGGRKRPGRARWLAFLGKACAKGREYALGVGRHLSAASQGIAQNKVEVVVFASMMRHNVDQHTLRSGDMMQDLHRLAVNKW